MRYLLSNLAKAFTALATRRLTVTSDGIPYTFENLSYKKILNACLTEASTYVKPLRPWGKPINIMIEPSTHCNLKCTLCPITTGLDRPTGNMDLEIFEKVISDVGDYIFTLMLWDWGEPFVNPNVYDMISIAKRYDINVISSTNGHMFEHKNHAEQLVRSGIDSIIFAIDGIHQDTYSKYRQDGKLDTALNGIRAVVAEKDRLKSKTPFVVFRFIVMDHNEHEIPELKRLAASLRVDALALKTLNAASQDPYFEVASSKREDYTRFVPKDPKYRRFRFGDGGLKSIRRRKNPCRYLWNAPCVHWDGKVVPCTFDPRDKYVLGDVTSHSLTEIWSGKGYREMRKRFRGEWDKIGLCTECTYAYRGGDCTRETTAEAVLFTNGKNHGQ
jgi:radical SAM protein with 4Fe4S-binding SPASM domain